MAALLKPRLKLGRRAPLVAGLDAVRAAVLSFAPERMASRCGTSADAICTLTRELAHAPRSDLYGRMGTSVPAYGTLCAWLSDVLNILAGNLNRAGGVMFPKAAAISANTSETGGKGRSIRTGRWKSRVLMDERRPDPLSGNAVLSGVEVTLSAA